MVTGFIDTAILVDVLRQHSPTLSWLANQQALGVTTIVWLELLEKAPNKIAMQRAVTLLQQFERIDNTTPAFDWAIYQLAKFKLSHGVGMMDCLIAAVSYRLQLPVYTTNMKHFTVLLGGLAQRPY